jgi:hypothetical protein
MPSVHTRHGLVVVTLLIIVLSSFLDDAHAQTQPEQLTILDLPLLFVDPATNTAGVHIRLVNKGPQPIAKISLSAGPFESKSSGKDIGAKVTFTGPTDAAAKSTYELASLAPQVIQTVKVDIVGLWEAGESVAPLNNNGNKIGELKAVKYTPPFAVKLSAPSGVAGSTENMEIAFEQDQPREITLKNEDAMTYPVTWELTIGGKTVSSDKPVMMFPKSTLPITINPPKEWFSTTSGLLKDELKDGTLTLKLRPPLSVDYPLLPQQSLPIKARLRSVSQTTQSFLAIGFVLLALVAGAVCSLLLRDLMPNRLRRVRLEGNLDEIASSLQDLDRLKDSSLTVPVSVERNRLLKNLQAPRFFSPDITAVFGECQEGIDVLSKRIAVLEELARAWELLYEKQQTVAPSLILTAREKIREAASLLRRTQPREKNLEEPKARLAAARQILESTGPDAIFSKELANRVSELQGPFSATEVNKGTYQRFKKQLDDFLKVLDGRYSDETKIHPKDYFDLDLKTSLLRLIAKYHALVEQLSASSDPQIREKENQCYEYFLTCLDMKTFEGFRNASIIVNELEQNIFADSLREALQADPTSLSIQVDTVTVRANHPVQLSAWFTSPPQLNKAAAREKINCIWEFAHGEDFTSAGLKGRGWVIWHYFPAPKICKARVSFVDEDTRQPIMRNGKEVTIEQTIEVLPEISGRSGERFKIEATTFVIALGVALLGLVAGASEQLSKLDLAAGFVAVFLIGFSADTIKNLLTQPSREKKTELPAPAALPTPKPDSAALVVKSP